MRCGSIDGRNCSVGEGLDKSEDVRSFISLSLRREFIPASSRELRKSFPLACYR